MDIKVHLVANVEQYVTSVPAWKVVRVGTVALRGHSTQILVSLVSRATVRHPTNNAEVRHEGTRLQRARPKELGRSS